MHPPDQPDPSKETVFIHELSPELEEELMRRARENGRDPSTEAADLIEKHVEDDPLS
jgi:predicted DNA-binding protein